MKNADQYIFIDKALLVKLSVNELKKHCLPIEMEELVHLRETLGKDYTKDTDLLMQAENRSTLGMWRIRQFLSKNWTMETMESWENLRKTVLSYPTASEEVLAQNNIIKELYITSGQPQNKYIYSQNSDFRDVTIDFTMDKIGFSNSERAKRRSETERVAVFEMSENNSGLREALCYPGLREFFIKNGYAVEFTEQLFLMSPVLFHNIYKGALGEVAGSFILENELGICLNGIKDPGRFEFFDFEMAPDVYVDFKNWKFSYRRDRGKIKKEISRKMELIGAKRVYIISLFGNEDHHVGSTSIDERIIEIPGLINRDGTVISKNLRLIKEEDFS